MLPISEFHFAFCGIATVAATLGYACARRVALSLVLPSKADVEAAHEQRSLKRKLDDSEEHDVDTQEQSRPMKRNRTPPSSKPDLDEDEWQVVVAPPTYEQATAPQQLEVPVQHNGTPSQEITSNAKHDITPVREPTPPAHPHPETLSQPEEKGAETGRCATPQPSQVGLLPNESKTPSLFATPIKPAVQAKIKPINAFSAFSGSSSPFASYSKASGTSPFALSGQGVKATPAWRHDNESESDVFGQTNSANALAPTPNDALSSATTQPPALSHIRVSSETRPLVKPCAHLTGEENETVEAELKGAKLFIKRGRKEFTDGMYGNIRILTQKSTLPQISSEDPQSETSSRTRLLFRRDPLGQVSMNVALHPAVRCHFDAAENILRVILMEQVQTDARNPKEDDVFIYALKPGRASKADFLSFTKTLCGHEGLQSREAASSVAPNDATAS